MVHDTTPTAPVASALASASSSDTPRSSRLGVPDLVSIGVFAALYFVMVCVATLVSTLFTGGFGSIFLPAIAALISGPVFMLAAARTPKFGGITVMGLVIGLFLFVSGHFVLSFVASVVFPVAADLIARAGAYRGKAALLVSYIVFSCGLTGPILPLWFMKDAYVASLEARGKDAAYIDGMFANITMGTFAAGRWRMAPRFAPLHSPALALGSLDPQALGMPWLHVVAALAVGAAMMLPCLITGAYAFTTTSASAFVCAMRRMHVPEAVVVPCVVIIRFFPTVGEDYRAIRDAMVLRGLVSGRFAVLRHPARTLEYVIVPLLMNATIVAQDLSVAALTKGLRRDGAHTSRTTIRMTVADWTVMAACAVPLALDIAGVIG